MNRRKAFNIKNLLLIKTQKTEIIIMKITKIVIYQIKKQIR